MELGAWIGVQEKLVLEPGEPARDTLLIFEVVEGTIRRLWAMKGDESGDELTGGEGRVGLSIEKWNDKDLPRLLATYNEGAVLYDLATGQRLAAGEEALRDRFEKTFETSPHFRVEVLQRMAVGPWVVYRERAVIGAADERVDSIAIYQVRDGLIRRVWFLS